MAHDHRMERHGADRVQGSYAVLGVELAIDFVIMYLVMYTMIATVDHLYLNINNAYMTLMMVAPMAVVMLAAMRSMYPAPAANLAIGALAVVVFVGGFVAMRSQAAVGNEQFLRSMIPHHSGAILMCEQAAITDPEIVALCGQIVEAQRAEIAQMEAILARM